MTMNLGKIQEILGNQAPSLLEHRAKGIPAASLHLPGPDFIDRILVPSVRWAQMFRYLPPVWTVLTIPTCRTVKRACSTVSQFGISVPAGFAGSIFPGPCGGGCKPMWPHLMSCICIRYFCFQPIWRRAFAAPQRFLM